MKRATLNHPKLKMLMSELDIGRREALGMLTLLWDFTGQYAPTGAIGRFTNAVIADACDWPTDGAGELVDALVRSGWLDETADQSVRLIVHDWSDHCEDWVKKRVKRDGKSFIGKDLEPTKHRAGGSVSGQSGGTERRDETAGRNGTPKCAPSPAPTPSPAMPSQSQAKPLANGEPGGDSVSPSERYTIEHDDVQTVEDAIPASRRRKPPRMREAIREAIVLIRRNGQSVEWLAARIAAYYASPEGKGKYFSEPANWLTDQRWSESDEVWQSRDPPKKSSFQKAIENEQKREQAGEPQ